MASKKSARRRWIVFAVAIGVSMIGVLVTLRLLGGTTSRVFETTAPRLSAGSDGSVRRDGAAPGFTPKSSIILDK